MFNNSTIKKGMRLSRFSQIIPKDIFKSFQLSFKKQLQSEKQNNISADLIESLGTSKRSIFHDSRRASKLPKNLTDLILQNKQDNEINQNQDTKNKKYFDSDTIKKYKQTLLQLPNLYQKNRKQKNKYICLDFIHFLFQIMKKQDFITKVLDSYVPDENIIAEFINMLHGFQIEYFKKGRTIQVNKIESSFLILIQGATQKISVRESNPSPRKSIIQNSSQTSIFRRSKVKNKTISQKGKLTCFQFNSPILINYPESNITTLIQSTFIHVQKGLWNKFLLTLQKLQEKYLLNFIKHCTTINLNIYVQKQIKNQEKEEELQKRKPFLYYYRNQKQLQQSEQQSQIMDGPKVGLVKKPTFYGNNVTNSYKLINILKDQKQVIDNQNIYLIVKGSLYLYTQYYSMVINEGSIINSSILLKLQMSEVRIKALVDSLIVKLILSQIYFRKQDEQDFLNKINQIQLCRHKIFKKKYVNPLQISHKNSQPSQKKYQSKSKQLNSSRYNTINENSFINNKPINNSDIDLQRQTQNVYKISSPKKSTFQPEQLRLKQLNFNKQNLKSFRKSKTKRQRIKHIYNKTGIISNLQKNKQISQTSQLINQSNQVPLQKIQNLRKVAVKYANNYCIFQKIVESQQKVIEKYNLNRVNKLFPIQALLRNLTFKKHLQIENQTQKKKSTKKVNFFKTQLTQQNQVQNAKEFNFNHSYDKKSTRSSKSSKKSFKSKKSGKSIKNDKEIKLLQKRRIKLQKSKLQKKKNQRAKIIQNLFQLKTIDQKNSAFDSLKLQQHVKRRKQPTSLDFHKQRIKLIVAKNQQMKLKQLNNEKNFIAFKQLNEANDTQQVIPQSENQTSQKQIRNAFSHRKSMPFKQGKTHFGKQRYMTWTDQDKQNIKQSFIYGQKSFQQLENLDNSKFKKDLIFWQNKENKPFLMSLKLKSDFSLGDLFQKGRKQTKNIMTKMLAGRIRTSRNA